MRICSRMGAVRGTYQIYHTREGVGRGSRKPGDLLCAVEMECFRRELPVRYHCRGGLAGAVLCGGAGCAVCRTAWPVFCWLRSGAAWVLRALRLTIGGSDTSKVQNDSLEMCGCKAHGRRTL